MSATLQVTIDQLDQSLVISPSGRLDTLSAPEFDAQVAPALADARPRILLDMAQVVYISSGGLRSILQLAKHAASQGGRLGVFSVPAPILEVIEMAGFPSLINLYPDRAAALGAQTASPA